MKAYWDSSALVEAIIDPEIKQRLENENGFTRPHTLAETFSALTGNQQLRIDGGSAARILENISTRLEFVELSAREILNALKTARQKGVRGGRVHDYLHAVAAEKSAKKILTLDRNDFDGLTKLSIEQI
ncbi:MAG: type II toxin-antitoxin system VapC family toxin [Limisphaerales bacterium]